MAGKYDRPLTPSTTSTTTATTTINMGDMDHNGNKSCQFLVLSLVLLNVHVHFNHVIVKLIQLKVVI